MYTKTSDASLIHVDILFQAKQHQRSDSRGRMCGNLMGLLVDRCSTIENKLRLSLGLQETKMASVHVAQQINDTLQKPVQKNVHEAREK